MYQKHKNPEELKKSNGAQGQESLQLEKDPVLRVAEAKKY
jgi:hypothetical protein